MKITGLETFIVAPRWCFLKITTDEGLVGWGEPVLEGRAHTVAAAVEELADYLIGEDPLQIERHWQTLYRGGFYRGGGIHMSAIAGIDQALWDIKGKFHDTPVHQLLGGQVRDRIRVYAWVGGDRPADIVSSAQRAISDGFKATKMNLTEEMQIEKVEEGCWAEQHTNLGAYIGWQLSEINGIVITDVKDYESAVAKSFSEGDNVRVTMQVRFTNNLFSNYFISMISKCT